MQKKDDNAAQLCFKLFTSSGKIGYYELYKQLEKDEPGEN